MIRTSFYLVCAPFIVFFNHYTTKATNYLFLYEGIVAPNFKKSENLSRIVIYFEYLSLTDRLLYIVQFSTLFHTIAIVT